jgi:hypothetical protein
MFSGGENPTIKYYIIGAVFENKIHCNQWLIPEIIQTGNEIRDMIDIDDPKLIINTVS